MAYKISKSSENELRKALNNFNAKIKRLETVDREIDIPEKESIAAIKDRVKTKWDLNREIDKLERFTKRNAEDLIKNKSGVVMSRWEYENLQREQKRLSARLLREIKNYSEIKPTILGEKTNFTYAQMGDERLSNLQDRYRAISKSNINKLNRDDLKSLQKLLNKTSAIYKRDKTTFYDSFLDGTLLNLAYQTGYDPNKIKEIREQLSRLSPNQFIKAFNSEEGLKGIQDRYIISKEQGVRIEDISEDVNQILDELYNNLPKILENYK